MPSSQFPVLSCCPSRLSVLGLVVQFDHAAGALLLGIDHAGIKRAGIDVQADGALVEFARIVDPVHGLQGIDGAGLARIHLHCVGGLEFAGAGSRFCEMVR